jgi:hypothetical protein
MYEEMLCGIVDMVKHLSEDKHTQKRGPNMRE